MKWENLTDRQKALDKAIEHCGIKLDKSEACLRKVMAAIGAGAGEADYVQSRIALRLRVAELLGSVDTWTENTEKMLDRFEKDDEEWRRKGHKLGIDF